MSASRGERVPRAPQQHERRARHAMQTFVRRGGHRVETRVGEVDRLRAGLPIRQMKILTAGFPCPAQPLAPSRKHSER